MVNLLFIKTFIDAAKTGSVRQSAENNFVTQPAVSQHIRLLENKFGCRLFERRQRKLALTEAGRIFLQHAESLMALYTQAKSEMMQYSQHPRYALHLGTIYSLGLYELQPILKRFLKFHPTTDVSLEYHPFDKIYRLVADQEIDFGFVAHPKPYPNTVSEVFLRERMLLVQSTARPSFPSKKIISPKLLDDVKLISFRLGTPTREATDACWKALGCRPQVINEYDNIETLKSVLCLGLGCALIPETTVKREIRDGVLEVVRVRGLDVTRPLGVVYAKNRPFHVIGKKFLESLKSGVRAQAEEIS